MGEEGFRGYTTREYRLRSGATFALAPGFSGPGASFEGRLAPSGGQLWSILAWRLEATAAADYKASLSLLDLRGHVAGQTGSILLRGMDPTSRWLLGEGTRTYHILPIFSGVAPGEYRLRLRVYEASPAQPGAFGPGIRYLGDEVDLGPVTVTSPPRPVQFTPQEMGTPSLVGLGPRVLERARLFTPSSISNPLRAELEGKVALLGYDLEGDFRPDCLVRLTLYWQALAPMDQSYTAFAHLLDRQNRIWAQHDGIPAGDSPTSGWLEGEVVVDSHTLPIRGDAPPGEYVLKVGMYEARSGRRLAVSAAQTQVVDQALWLRRLEVR